MNEHIKCECIPAVVDGNHYVPWIGEILGTCAYSTTDILSVAFGLGNIVCWMFAQAPQLFLNWRRGKVEALSPSFLVLWLTGDICNLVGCVLTQQLPVQLYTSIYFVFMDCLMVAQYAYYARSDAVMLETGAIVSEKLPLIDPQPGLYGSVQDRYGASGSGSSAGGSSRSSTLPTSAEYLSSRRPGAGSRLGQGLNNSMATALTVGLIAVSMVQVTMATSHETPAVLLPHSCEYRPPIAESSRIIGIVVAWLSGLVYFFARLPQVMLNYRRKNVDGLSFPMFLMAVLGNSLYGASILVRSPTVDLDFVLETLPYLVGSLCTLLFSGVIVSQFCIYRWVPRLRGDTAQVRSSSSVGYIE